MLVLFKRKWILKIELALLDLSIRIFFLYYIGILQILIKNLHCSDVERGGRTRGAAGSPRAALDDPCSSVCRAPYVLYLHSTPEMDVSLCLTRLSLGYDCERLCTRKSRLGYTFP